MTLLLSHLSFLSQLKPTGFFSFSSSSKHLPEIGWVFLLSSTGFRFANWVFLSFPSFGFHFAGWGFFCEFGALLFHRYHGQNSGGGLLNLQLTKEEEEEISIKTRCKSNLLEECSLSLFGRLLTDRHQNQRALKNTMRAAWKMDSDLQIVDVGNNILQFKFGFEYQLKWVEQNGPWNFDNNLLLLCRRRRGLSAANIKFTHSPFWVQIWVLPFELMSKEVGRELGNSIGRFIEMDRRAT